MVDVHFLLVVGSPHEHPSIHPSFSHQSKCLAFHLAVIPSFHSLSPSPFYKNTRHLFHVTLQRGMAWTFYIHCSFIHFETSACTPYPSCSIQPESLPSSYHQALLQQKCTQKSTVPTPWSHVLCYLAVHCRPHFLFVMWFNSESCGLKSLATGE